MKVRKAVIPAAGFGTRFLPATRSVPKGMIPVLDRPAIHYSVSEAVAAGIEQIVIVISRGQEAIGKYFDRVPDLEQALRRRGDTAVMERMREISEMAEISCIYQDEQLGLGHAVLTARAAVGDEPFAVFLPDDLICSDAPTMGRMLQIFGEYHGSVVAVREVPDESVSSLGIIDARPMDETMYRLAGVVEKPAIEEAPSNLAIIGRYVLSPRVFEALETVQPGALGEIQLTDAIARLLSSESVYAYRFPGVHFDVGTPVGLLKASVYTALERGDISSDFREWLGGVL